MPRRGRGPGGRRSGCLCRAGAGHRRVRRAERPGWSRSVPVPSSTWSGSQAGLARREAPTGTLPAEPPTPWSTTFPDPGALERGEITEEPALLVVRETDDLAPDDRVRVDVAPWPTAPRRAPPPLSAPSRPRDLVCRPRRRPTPTPVPNGEGRGSRHVAGRTPATARGGSLAVVRSEHYGPVTQALRDAAAAARAAGDPRTADQVRADASSNDVPAWTRSPRAVSTRPVPSLEQPARRERRGGARAGPGDLPVEVCRELLGGGLRPARGGGAAMFALPEDGQLVAVEQTTRRFDGLLAEMIRLRDGERCRTRGATRPSVISTTSCRPARTAPQRTGTARACARRATR